MHSTFQSPVLSIRGKDQFESVIYGKFGSRRVRAKFRKYSYPYHPLDRLVKKDRRRATSALHPCVSTFFYFSPFSLSLSLPLVNIYSRVAMVNATPCLLVASFNLTFASNASNRETRRRRGKRPAISRNIGKSSSDPTRTTDVFRVSHSWKQRFASLARPAT